jgi:hypothetical protein
MDNRIVVPAIHDWHLEKILSDLGLLGQVQRGMVTCSGCAEIVTMENLSALKLGPNQTILFVCDRNDCLAAAWTKK